MWGKKRKENNFRKIQKIDKSLENMEKFEKIIKRLFFPKKLRK